MNRFIAVGSLLCAGLFWIGLGSHPASALAQEAPEPPSVGPSSPSDEFSEGLKVLETLNKQYQAGMMDSRQYEASMEQWRHKYFKGQSKPATPMLSGDEDLFAPHSSKPAASSNLDDLFAPQGNPAQPRHGDSLPEADVGPLFGEPLPEPDEGPQISVPPPPGFDSSQPDTTLPQPRPAHDSPVLPPPEDAESFEPAATREALKEIRDQFRALPEILELSNRIKNLKEQLQRVKRLVRDPSDPVYKRKREELDAARRDWQVLWQRMYPKLKKRLSLSSPAPSTEEEAVPVPVPSTVFPPETETDFEPPASSEPVLDDNPLLPHTGAKDDKIRPLPLPPIPDDPPPHEGAMINMPILVEPPDLLTVEVLEGLPGRPITGERLVRPDGTITLGFYGDVQVRGLTLSQVKTRIILHLRKYLTDEVLGLTGLGPDGSPILIPPEESDRVFVDFAAYNSDVYYVEGRTHRPGRLCITGNDTVLDALNHAGGLAPGADPYNIQLIRPARDGQPRKIYKVNFDKLFRGDPTANLQVFPNDRLYVGPKQPAEKDDGKSKTKASHTLQISRDIRALETAIRKIDATPAQRRAVADRVIDLYVHSTNAPGAEKLDESRVRADLKAILDLVTPSKVEDEPEEE